MNEKNVASRRAADELPDSWWYRVYAAVIAVTILVLFALSAFSNYFSS